jgi:hypothetical protein
MQEDGRVKLTDGVMVLLANVFTGRTKYLIHKAMKEKMKRK